MNPSSFFFPTLTRYVQAWFKSTIFRTHLVLCGNLSFFITHYGPALVTPSHAGAAPPGFFVLFPARTVIGWFNAKIYNSSSFLFPGLLYPPGAPPCSFTNAPTPCRGHGLAACYAGARRVQRRVWGLRRATCRRTFMTRLMLRHKKKVAKRRLKIKQNFYIWLYC